MSLGAKPGYEERRLWHLWVLANAIGEALGLGVTALVGVAAIELQADLYSQPERRNQT